MIDPDAVECVIKGQNALDFVGSYRHLKDVTNAKHQSAGLSTRSGNTVRRCENRTEIVGRMSPFLG